MQVKLDNLVNIRQRAGKTSTWLFAVIGFMLISFTGRPMLAQELAVTGDLEDSNPGQVKKRSLEKYLVELEDHFEVAFNYNSELVKDKLVFVDPDNSDLDNSLENILGQLNLKYKKIGEDLFVIKQAKKRKMIQKLAPRGPSEKIGKNNTSRADIKLQNLTAGRANTLGNRIPSSQDVTVSGTVTSEEGEPLPGVNVVVQGSPGSGTVTNANGEYTLSAPENGTLVFSFVGYVTEEISINGRSNIDVTMVQDIGELEEVVVTAFGIEREEKSLTYSTQQVDNTEIQQARELNITNSLKGKVAGIDIKTAASGVGGGTRVTLRGNRSLSGGNQPLYIVDGMPIRGDISDLSPDNIQNINVLKGANAAALYGQRAQNGAILITTKGGQFEDKETTLSFNQTYMRNSPQILTEFQNQYGQGLGGSYGPRIEQNWGPAFNEVDEVQHWSPDPNWSEDTYPYEAQPNNVRDVYQTGYNSATSIALSSSTETSSSRFSYTFTDAAGVVPKNNLSRHNIFVRTANKLNQNLTVDAKLQYIREGIDNSLSTGESFANPNRHAYRLSRNIRTEDISQESYLDQDGRLKQHYYNPGSNGGANPYWAIRRNLNESTSDELISYANFTYNLTDAISLQARSSVDVNRWDNKSWMYNDTYIIAQDGNFSVGHGTGLEWNSNFLATYQEDITENWFVNVNLGGNIRQERNSSLSGNTSPGLTVRNFFALSNAEQSLAGHNPGGPKDVHSVFGSAEIGFLNAIFLDITGRNDWSSSLPPENWSFFYPSVGLNMVVSDLVDLPDFWSFFKLRGSYAEVGNDAPVQRTTQTANFTSGGANGFLQLSSTKPATDLLPERTKSTEIGADLRFFEGDLRLDGTWYKANSFNQLFSIQLPVGSGFSRIFTNGGNVQNKGWEFMANATAFESDFFTWNISANWNTNDNKVLEIHDERPRVSRGGSFLHTFILEQGKPWGIIESKGYVRDDQGRVIVNDAGIPKTTDAPNVPIANFQPDWMAGLTNRFSIGNFNASFLIDIREGGTVASLTNAILLNDGLTKETLHGREGGLVFGKNFFEEEEAVYEDSEGNFVENNIETSAEPFWRAMGGRNDPKGEAFVKSASNIRMREVTLGYTLPSSIIDETPFRNISINLVGRNLFFLQRDANYDPELIRSPGEGNVGFNSFTPPNSRNYGINLSLDF